MQTPEEEEQKINPSGYRHSQEEAFQMFYLN